MFKPNVVTGVSEFAFVDSECGIKVMVFEIKGGRHYAASAAQVRVICVIRFVTIAGSAVTELFS
jgi:hypothetical protein